MWEKKRLIMNKFPLIHVAKIFYLQHISLGLYIQLMRFQINVKWTAFKLLFSLKAQHWKKGILPDDRGTITGPLHSMNTAVLGNAISSRRWWGPFEGLRRLIWWRWCGEEEKRKGIKGDEDLRLGVSFSLLLFILSHKPAKFSDHYFSLRNP